MAATNGFFELAMRPRNCWPFVDSALISASVWQSRSCAMSAPAMKQPGLPEMSTTDLTLASLSTASSILRISPVMLALSVLTLEVLSSRRTSATPLAPFSSERYSPENDEKARASPRPAGAAGAALRSAA
jgi:hypothetical protein